MNARRTFYLILTGFILLLAFLLARAINNATTITTQNTDVPLVANDFTPLAIAPLNPILGNPGSNAEVVAFLDLHDSSGRAAYNQIAAFVRDDPTSIHLIFKHAPVEKLIFTDGILAHKGAYCSGKEKFWQFADEIATGKYKFDQNGIKLAAKAAGVDNEAWLLCLRTEAATIAVQKDLAEAQALERGKPPLIFVNNKQINISAGVPIKDILSAAVKK